MMLKHFFNKELPCCHITNYIIQLVTTVNTVNCLISTVDKTHHRPVITPFSVQMLKCLMQSFQLRQSVLVTNLFYRGYVSQEIFLVISPIAIFSTSSEELARQPKEQKMAKTASKSSQLRKFSLKAVIFVAALMHSLYGHHRNIKFEQNYQKHGPCFQAIFLFLMISL